jgi:hypothetical protein
MPKLKLKRTPQEERERALRKARKAARRAARERRYGTIDDGPDSLLFDFDKPSHSTLNGDINSGDEFGPPPPPKRKGTANYAQILEELEERRFREKMADAMDDDFSEGFSRLENIDAMLNDFSHVPRRWRTGSMRHAEAPDDYSGARRPEDMEDEEYAEYIRQGMWKYVITLVLVGLPFY